MAGLVRGIHVLFATEEVVDARHTCAKTRFALLAGHDEREELVLRRVDQHQLGIFQRGDLQLRLI